MNKISNHLARLLKRPMGWLRGKAIDKILSALGPEIQEVEDMLWDLLALYDIDSAEGIRLDTIGKILGISREGKEDTAYRLVLKAQIKILRSNGTIPEILDILGLLISNSVSISPIEFAKLYVAISGELDEKDTIIAILRRAKAGGVGLFLEYGVCPDEEAFAYEEEWEPEATATVLTDTCEGCTEIDVENVEGVFPTSGVIVLSKGEDAEEWAIFSDFDGTTFTLENPLVFPCQGGSGELFDTFTDSYLLNQGGNVQTDYWFLTGGYIWAWAPAGTNNWHLLSLNNPPWSEDFWYNPTEENYYMIRGRDAVEIYRITKASLDAGSPTYQWVYGGTPLGQIPYWSISAVFKNGYYRFIGRNGGYYATNNFSTWVGGTAAGYFGGAAAYNHTDEHWLTAWANYPNVVINKSTDYGVTWNNISVSGISGVTTLGTFFWDSSLNRYYILGVQAGSPYKWRLWYSDNGTSWTQTSYTPSSSATAADNALFASQGVLRFWHEGMSHGTFMESLDGGVTVSLQSTPFSIPISTSTKTIMASGNKWCWQGNQYANQNPIGIWWGGGDDATTISLEPPPNVGYDLGKYRTVEQA